MASIASPERVDPALDDDPALVDSTKAAMRLRRAPLAIVSTLAGRRPVGCTVSAFLSLSMRPPSVLISLRTGSETLRHIRSSSRFGLSLLADGHTRLAETFARGRCEDRFRATAYVLVGAVPLIGVAPAAFVCRVSAQFPVHDHTLVAGDIVHVETAGTPAREGEPR